MKKEDKIPEYQHIDPWKAFDTIWHKDFVN